MCVQEKGKRKREKRVRRDVIKCPVWDFLLTLNCSVIKRRLLWWQLICLRRHFSLWNTKYPGWVVWVWWPAGVSSWVLPWVCAGTRWNWCGLQQGLSLDRSKSENTFQTDSHAIWGYTELCFLSIWMGCYLKTTAFIFLNLGDLPDKIQQCNVWIRQITPSKHPPRSGK